VTQEVPTALLSQSQILILRNKKCKLNQKHIFSVYSSTPASRGDKEYRETYGERAEREPMMPIRGSGVGVAKRPSAQQCSEASNSAC